MSIFDDPQVFMMMFPCNTLSTEDIIKGFAEQGVEVTELHHLPHADQILDKARLEVHKLGGKFHVLNVADCAVQVVFEQADGKLFMDQRFVRVFRSERSA